MTPTPAEIIRIGISSCLLGEKVRFDGGHKRDPFLVDLFGRFVEWVPVCPEVELGLGTPRESLRLIRSAGEIRMVNTKSERDITDAMRDWSRRRADQLARERLAGYVFKKDSPSCGMERVKVYADGGVPGKNGRGLFADALMTRFPLLPCEEEGRLSDARLRDNFIERVFGYVRLRALFDRAWTLGDLVRFHTAHKMALLAHSTDIYNEMGRLVARAKSLPRTDLESRYRERFMAALALVATTRKHTNVLSHMAGHFKQVLDPADRQELVSVIDDYRRGLVPLIVPITLLRHHVRRHAIDYLAGQVYLDPHPKELLLRNHV